MNWDDIRIFLAIARTGQILAAARSLGLNHATVARRLSALEAALGSKLFIRRTNGCDLTAEGEAMLSHAETVESAIFAARAETGRTDETLSGTVRVGAPDGFGVAFLAPRLGQLTERHPDLTIQLVPIPRSFSLSRREADIAITLERPTQGRLVARKLIDYTLALYASRAYLDAHGTPTSVAGLRDHQRVGYVEDLIFTPSLNFARQIYPDWRSHFEISSAIGQTEAVRAGAGIGILHSFIARQYAELVPVLPEATIERSYWLVVHEDLRAIRRVGQVADFIVRQVRQANAIFAPAQ
ncbi:LysR family transcriptional regulator [Pelagibacterium xiamenense]|uniref:LysR family transcriptional regulator n=1 Tax=Pelagibacterium xiamenense TaxID=2901140 RepID=UPI001E57720A|nr:LysR family transcriptional regulator [Pelagibacterium xiamenense]MCD7060195.1 LysR family transcriptional regulator [Pelagibacterium xiamenense]